jgi:hypothetical protein
VLVADLVKSSSAISAPDRRGPASNKYALELDGRHCGWLTDLAGATAAGELGAAPRVDEFSLRCWPAMPRGFYQWVLRSFDAEPSGSDGLLVLADDDFRELSRLRWTGGVVTEFTTTAVDVAATEAAKVALKFSPLATQADAPITSPRISGPHAAASARLSGPHAAARPVLGGPALDTRWPGPASMPEVHIDGLEEATCHIKRIESLVVRQRVARVAGERGVRCEREAPGIYTSPLVLTLPEAKAQGFVRWLEACEAGRSNGRTGSILLGAPAVGFTVALHGLRPARISDVAAADSDDPRRRDLRVELKVRDIAFALAPSK